MIIIEKNDLIELLNHFKDKAFCHHSHYKAGQIWRELEKFIEQPYLRQIGIEWQHIQLGHGFKEWCESMLYDYTTEFKNNYNNRTNKDSTNHVIQGCIKGQLNQVKAIEIILRSV